MKENFSIENDKDYTKDRALASNTLTILNAAGDNIFKGVNFDCCEIPHAILSDNNWLFFETSFNYANLYKCEIERVDI